MIGINYRNSTVLSKFCLVHQRIESQPEFNAQPNCILYCTPVIVFSKRNKLVLGCFDPVHVLCTLKVNNFRGDLTDVSAKTKTLLHTLRTAARVLQWGHLGMREPERVSSRIEHIAGTKRQLSCPVSARSSIVANIGPLSPALILLWLLISFWGCFDPTNTILSNKNNKVQG